MVTGTSAKARDDGNVSRYLLRRLRSHQEALSERIRRRQHERAEDRPGERPSEERGVAKPSRHPGDETDRDV